MGSIRIFRNDPLRFVEQNRDLYGDIVHTGFLNRDVYQVNQPDYIQQVLVRQASNFHKSPMLKKATSIALGNGLLNSEGEFHKRQRKLAQPAFHQQRIARYADVMVSYTQQALENWHTGDQRDIHHEMMKLTMEIVAKTLFDADIRESADNIGEAITTAIELSS
ncbi:MAG: cytochrome P450, partial [Anaerolineae bacterium]|nr:cytochrome P450 [Anaerolineae bacterium]